MYNEVQDKNRTVTTQKNDPILKRKEALVIKL
jgi:hypothetical protein